MISRLAVSVAVLLLQVPQEQETTPAEQLTADTVVAADSGQVVPVDPDRFEADRQLQGDLRATFDRIPGLEGVEADVEAGVVFLTGTALSAGEAALADSLAARMPEVLYVENRIATETSLRVRLGPVWTNLQDSFINSLALFPLVLVALFLVLAFFFLARAIYGWDTLFRRLGKNPFLSNLLRQIVGGGVALSGVLLALQLLDATALVGAVLGAAGVVGIAVGFAFRNIAENYLAGIILSIRQPFFPNDHVLVEGQEGKIIRLTSRETVLMTLDGNHVRIPNATIFNSVVTNFTKNPLRRFRFDLSVGQNEDLARAQEIGLAALSAMDGVLDDPGPRSVVVEVGDSWVLLRFFGWVDQNRVGFDKAKSESVRVVLESLNTAGVSMPAPEYGLRVLAGPEWPELQPTPTSFRGKGREAAPAPAVSGAEPPSEPKPPPGRVGDLSPDLELEAQIDQDRENADEGDLLTSES